MKKVKSTLSVGKRIVLLSLCMTMFSVAGFSQGAKGKKVKGAPVFLQAVYQGNDQVYNENPLQAGEFYNPILQGCYPDPSITRKGDDYFLVCSSFAMFPGVPIFHSKDLVNWTQIGHVLDRTSQLKVHDTGISAGVYAPAIKYNPNNDTFYMITTQFAGGFGNIIVKSKDPFKGWSDPIKLNFDGIDPSIFFDDNGKAYVVHNDGPKRGEELYNGHRVIKIWEYDVENDQVIPGSDQVIVNGGVDLSKKPIWIEAPHIYKKNGRYYLMCAEGGTGDWHSEVIFVSDSPKGPFIPAPNNPILSQRYLNQNRKNMVDWAGHADLVEGPDGKYYGVFLAIRPNEKGRVNIGRETFILPVDWSGEFPVFENGLIPMEPKLKTPKGVENKAGKDGYFPNGNFTFTENFTSPQLDYRWIGLRGPREEFISVLKDGGLQITPFPVNIKEVKSTSTLFYRQQHNNFSFTTTLQYVPKTEKDLAGITCVQSEKFNYVFGLTKKDKDFYMVLERTARGKSGLVASAKVDVKNPIQLRVKGEGDGYGFYYSTDGTDFVQLGNTVPGDILSTNVAGGFTGCLIGLYATSANDIVVNNLKDAYADYFTVGCAINMANLNSPQQMALITSNFNSITAENDMKPQPTEPVEGQWNWESADKIANFARANKIGLRGHCLVWHAQTPDWMFHDEKGNLVSKEVLFERMRKHIHTIVNRYKDVVYAWDVVNEAMTDDPKAEVPYRQSLYYKIAEDEFIKKAFEYAHEADPKALLFYNDYNETNPAKRDRIYNMVKSMKAEGIPISGIGMQGHYNTLSPTEDEFRKAIELYSQVVDNIHITELDVRINTREQGGQLSVNQDNRTLELTPEADEAQVAQYDMLFRVMREYKNVVSNVTFWNVYDGDSWLDRRRGNRQRNYPLLFDENLLPKSSYYKVLNF